MAGIRMVWLALAAAVVTAGLAPWKAGWSVAAAQESGGAATELHRVTVGDVTAHWGGERGEADADMPPEYSVTQLWFTFRGDARPYAFRPQGELFFSDWRFDIFAPDGRHVLLLQDRYGPYHIVSIDRLRAYLDGSAQPDHVVDGNAPDEPRGVHHDARWTSAEAIEFSLSCCATTEKRQFRIPGSAN